MNVRWWWVLPIIVSLWGGSYGDQSKEKYQRDESMQDAFQKKLDNARREAESIGALGEDPGGERDQNDQSKKDVTIRNVIMRMSFYVGIIVVILLIIVWLLKKNGIREGVSEGGASDILEIVSTGQGKSIVFMRVLDNVLVIGQTAQNMVLIDKYENEKAIEIISSSKGGSSIKQFKEVLNSFLGKSKKSM